MVSSRGEHLQDRKVSVERAWSNILQNTMFAALEDVRMRLQEVIGKKEAMYNDFVILSFETNYVLIHIWYQ